MVHALVTEIIKKPKKVSSKSFTIGLNYHLFGPLRVTFVVGNWSYHVTKTIENIN